MSQKRKLRRSAARGGFGTGLQPRNPAALGTEGFSPEDYLMLRAGKQAVEQQADVFAVADERVLVVVDMRDQLGALWACIQMGVFDNVADGDDERARQLIAEYRETIINTSQGPNPHPLVSFWTDREANVLDWLTETGFRVPKDWYEHFATPPQAGNVYTILKRDGRGLLVSVDYTQIESLGAELIATGNK